MLAAIRQHCQAILAAVPANRMLALDVLRGLTITAMILVNNPGSWSYVYSPLLHAKWHGWTFTDLIFPFFIVIVGMSLQLSLQRQQTATKAALLKHALLRSVKLYLLGLFLVLFYYNFRDPSYNYIEQKLMAVRALGVLQRIALVYFFTMLIALYCATRGRIIAMLMLCALYLAAMWYLPYQDAYGQQFVGLLEFGNSFAAWLDHTVLGAQHVYYRTATPFAFDPEGLWSTLPAIASCVSGLLIAQWLQAQRTLVQKARGLLLCGVVAVWLAELWHFSLPINKSLWTPSFVLLSSGYCAIALATCLWLCDIKKYRLWSAPFVVFGANAILFFMFAGIAARLLGMIPAGDISLQSWLFSNLYQPAFGNYNGSLAFAISFLLLSYLLMHWCYKRGIFLKV
ncbi:acyltransferase family protein [Rheinheimera aquimaris]|jgi:predicted acyltransferase|uniref:acyltransferase family protein n=1 Tax=Rheinheimera aquimaris TaxID=412437 RepID=UPI0010658290|nr:heparan-alpha-glucosaminide N-acetyltransferase domain-containing protein [Rheinheimera aquimaris]MCD1599949.1 heparan-alpha-glucosaminide N-acetyltransferase domain-containing protein [Rheinheimera aquimaris]